MFEMMLIGLFFSTSVIIILMTVITLQKQRKLYLSFDIHSTDGSNFITKENLSIDLIIDNKGKFNITIDEYCINTNCGISSKNLYSEGKTLTIDSFSKFTLSNISLHHEVLLKDIMCLNYFHFLDSTQTLWEMPKHEIKKVNKILETQLPITL